MADGPQTSDLRFLLLQMRDHDDPMREQEVDCFAEAIECRRDRIQPFDLVSARPTKAQLDAVDIVLIGGSGDYSVAAGGPWSDHAQATVVQLVETAKPTFASCWGFQLLAQALGGVVVTDLKRAELGVIEAELTESGQADPVFSYLPSTVLIPQGHQDIVHELPAEIVPLVSTTKVPNQAFRIPDKPIYATQFHPELSRQRLTERLVNYPQYVERIAGMACDVFIETMATPNVQGLIRSFISNCIND